VTVAEVARWLMRRKKLRARQATAVTMALVQWAIASDRVGHFVTIAEFVAWSGESQRTVERRSSRIRKVLSEEEFRYLVGALVVGIAGVDGEQLAEPA
jgi:hypothetical protein